MGRFASTAAVYESARPPYGAAFFAAAAARLGLSGHERLLDLGTGPGLLAFGFAPFVGPVVGVDPEPAMLALARAAAARLDPEPRFLAGRAEDLPDDIGRFDLVTIGRALHWMEPEPTRATLGRVVAQGGRILVCRAATLPGSANPWLPAYEATRRRWTEAHPPARLDRDHDAFFAGTRFRRRDTIAVTQDHAVSLHGLADRVLSMSSSSPARLGGDAEAMRAVLLAALAPFASAGQLREIVEARAEVFG